MGDPGWTTVRRYARSVDRIEVAGRRTPDAGRVQEVRPCSQRKIGMERTDWARLATSCCVTRLCSGKAFGIVWGML
jgi:hypothetical protein